MLSETASAQANYKPPRSLLRYGLTIAGPRDAVINLLINGTICWNLLRSVESVPLLGPLSVESFMGPMFFLLFSLATFFGVLNGVIERRSGRSGPPLDSATPWLAKAVGWGLLYGVTALALFLLAIHLADRVWPTATLSGWSMIVLQTLLSAVLGFLVQVNGVLKSASL
jgi:hypothetical protein